MKPLFKNYKTLKATLDKAQKILLLLDYDGTLTPIVAHPDLAVLHPSMKAVLKKIAKKDKIILGIVSGRSLKDVYNKLKLTSKGIFYAGNHGLEMKTGSKIVVSPMVRPHLKTIRKLEKLASKLTKNIPGAWVEDKNLTLSVHYRQCKEKDAKILEKSFNKLIKPWLKKIRLTTGKMVWEIRPPVKWNKGEAVKWLIEQYSNRYTPLPIYIGDDRTDEDAFEALPDWGVGIYVGQNNKSAAKYKLKSVPEVKKFLQLLSKI
ncbi:MAG: trehalose-phosphatase [Endomicrobiales bacterium]|nr:trehalose-phosphatase [Endomicrobiales bacterium]